MRRLNPFQRRLIDLRAAQKAHDLHPPKGCRCERCVGSEGIRAILDAKLAEQDRRNGPAPF